MSDRRIERVILFDYVKRLFTEMKGGILISYAKLTANQMSDLRKRVRKSNGGIVVLRNSYIRLGMEACGASLPNDFVLSGDTALLYTFTDPVAIAKLAKELSKEIETIKIKGGILEKQYLSVQDVNTLAETPPREVLLGMLVGMIGRPAQELVNVISTRKNSLVWLLENYIKKLEEAQS